MTSDLQVPTYKAVISDPARPPVYQFDISAGTGCHPVAARAAIRAITEAAQTRITTISGARDDFPPERYAQRIHPALVRYSNIAPNAGSGLGVASGLSLGTPINASFDHIVSRLRARGITDVFAVPLGGVLGVSVVRLTSASLEDSTANRHWRPGGRAVRAMAGLR